MAINVYWQDDTWTILRCDVIGEWTWEDYDIMVDRASAMIREVGHEVNLISDVSSSAQMPKGNALQHLRRVKTILPPNVKLMITVGQFSLYTSTILNAFLKVYARDSLRFMMAKTVEDAQNMIVKQSV
jgi:hypothetical protein